MLAYLRESRGVIGPHIAIVPKSVVGNWIREINRWCPSINVVRMGGTKQERDDFIKNHLHGNFDVLVTSYEGFLREKSKLAKVKWHYLIIDEVRMSWCVFSSFLYLLNVLLGPSHQVSGFVPQQGCTHSWNAVSAADYRYSASGLWCSRRLYLFPLLNVISSYTQNNLKELWALLNFIMPEIFGDEEYFSKWFSLSDESGKDNVVRKLHTVLRPFMLRRIKKDVGTLIQT